MLKNYVYFSNKDLSDFQTFVTNAGVYSAPARNYDSISVAGRNGNILMENNKFENVEHSYPVAVYDDFDHNFAALKSFLLSQTGYHRLADTFCPDEYYMATFSRFDSINQPLYHGTKGSCILIFDRKPQRYLKSGEVTIEMTSAGSLLNPTKFDARPVITVYGSGILTVNDVDVDVDTSETYLTLDCELQEILQAGGNLDVTLTNGEFPKLKSGENDISFTGFSKIRIQPRWWRL